MRVRFVIGTTLLLCLGAALLGACGDDDIAGSAPIASSAPGSSDSRSPDGTWLLEADGFDAPLTEDTTPTLTIAGSSWSGFGGCNRYTTTATVTGQKVELSPVASTRMACPDDASAVETLYLQRLDEVATFTTAGTTLELKDSDGEVVLRFTKR